MQKQAKITSKGQVTVPIEVRRILGVRPGDKIVFEGDESGIRVRPLRAQSALRKYRGIGNPGIGRGRKGIADWIKELRGEEHLCVFPSAPLARRECAAHLGEAGARKGGGVV
jgi:antitoxin PrlF